MYNYQILARLLDELTAETSINAHEVILLRNRLSCKNCKESTYASNAWVCKHHGAIPKDFKGACERWVNNIRDNK